MKFDTDIERELVQLMIDSHEALGGLNLRLRVELNSLLSDYILEVTSLSPNDVASFNILTQQLQDDISIVLAPLLSEYLSMAENAHDEALYTVLGHKYPSGDISIVGMTDTTASIEQAKQTTYNIIAALASEISSMAYGGLVNGFTASLISDLSDKKDSLLYQVRRHFEAFLSLMINEGVIQSSRLEGYTRWYWQIHPELTRSGTCTTCKGYSTGGVNNDGIYSEEDLPMIPVHPHCVCVLIPVL